MLGIDAHIVTIVDDSICVQSYWHKLLKATEFSMLNIVSTYMKCVNIIEITVYKKLLVKQVGFHMK